MWFRRFSLACCGKEQEVYLGRIRKRASMTRVRSKLCTCFGSFSRGVFPVKTCLKWAVRTFDAKGGFSGKWLMTKQEGTKDHGESCPIWDMRTKHLDLLESGMRKDVLIWRLWVWRVSLYGCIVFGLCTKDYTKRIYDDVQCILRDLRCVCLQQSVMIVMMTKEKRRYRGFGPDYEGANQSCVAPQFDGNVDVLL